MTDEEAVAMKERIRKFRAFSDKKLNEKLKRYLK